MQIVRSACIERKSGDRILNGYPILQLTSEERLCYLSILRNSLCAEVNVDGIASPLSSSVRLSRQKCASKRHGGVSYIGRTKSSLPSMMQSKYFLDAMPTLSTFKHACKKGTEDCDVRIRRPAKPPLSHALAIMRPLSLSITAFYCPSLVLALLS